jgi:spore coat protein A
MTVNPADPSSIPKFVAPLPIPHVLQPVGTECGRPLYEIRMEQFLHQFHPDFPLTPVWGYNRSLPGPTFEVEEGEAITVRYLNNLPQQHLLHVDHTIHGAEPFRPDVRNVVHLHGGNVPPEFDGNPDAWFTPGITETGPTFVTNVYHYPNNQPATTLWYHDHAVGITRLNVYAGLGGLYLIRRPDEQMLRLPRGPFEIPLLIQDRQFDELGRLDYPATIVPEFFGNTIAVNGVLWPFLAVEPRRYRFRFLNGSNARFYTLRLVPALPFHLIGTDQGFLQEPITLTELTLAPAERADVIVDFSGHEGVTFTLRNSAPTPFPGGDEPSPEMQVIMQFRVTLPLGGRDKSRIPRWLGTIPRLRPEEADRTRQVTLNEVTDEMDRVMPLLGIRDVHGRPLPLKWGDSTTEFPQLGSVEVWELINTTMDTHPIHLHLVRFRVVNRQPYDVDRLTATGELVFTGPPERPEGIEVGWKDTVRADPGFVTRIIARFCDFAGLFLWHCHILEHEDHEMMRRYRVTLGPATPLGPLSFPVSDGCGECEDDCSDSSS